MSSPAKNIMSQTAQCILSNLNSKDFSSKECPDIISNCAKQNGI
jgi:hypothetical protein